MRKALRRKSADGSLIDGFQIKKSSPVAFVREWIFGERPLTRWGAARRARAARSHGLKLEALEPRLLLSAELNTLALASVPMFETEGSYPPVVAASFSPSALEARPGTSSANAPVQAALPAPTQAQV